MKKMFMIFVLMFVAVMLFAKVVTDNSMIAKSKAMWTAYKSVKADCVDMNADTTCAVNYFLAKSAEAKNLLNWDGSVYEKIDELSQWPLNNAAYLLIMKFISSGQKDMSLLESAKDLIADENGLTITNEKVKVKAEKNLEFINKNLK